MGELEEKEIIASATETETSEQQQQRQQLQQQQQQQQQQHHQHQSDPVEEPKETDRMLENKEDTELLTHSEKFIQQQDNKKKSLLKSLTSSPVNIKKMDTNDKEDKVEEIINIQENDGNKSVEKSGATVTGPKAVTLVQIERSGGDDNEENDVADVEEDRNVVSDEKKISIEDREVKPKKIPIGGLKLPGFFMKSKPKPDGDGADGELLEKEQKSPEPIADNKSTNNDAIKKDEKLTRSFGMRLRNFFIRKTTADKELNKLKMATTTEDDNKSEVTAEAANTEGRDGQQKTLTVTDAPPQKRGLLNAIKLPIANMIPKKSPEDDVELGLSKAGLASMETLDDSLKDQECADKGSTNKNNGVDDISKLKKTSSSGDIMQANDEKTVDADEEQDVRITSFCQRLRSYKCTFDDILICLGIVLFLLLLAVIVFAVSNEILVGPPIREGRFVDAITGCGMVEGLKEDGVYAFRGIPFAQAPIGERRWRPAQAIESIEDCWNGTFAAYNSSVLCSQTLGNGTIIGDEDCLYLDIITPHLRYDTPLPVVVLIGAETLTGPSPGILEPSIQQARERNVIFVRPNFRLGAFGFLALEALTKDAYPHSSGNYALTDIIATLQWIKLNIAHFSGDPNAITLFGYRAGGTLVTALITSKKVEDLYTRAWVSSASAIYPGKFLSESEKRNQEFMQALECQSVECLRSASVEKIWSATPDTWLYVPGDIPTIEENTTAHHEWLVLDGDVLQEHPAESWKKEHNGGKLKLVMGTTAHESHTEKLYARGVSWTKEQVRDYLENSKIGILNLTDEAIQRYNASSYRDVIAMITDIRTICPLLINVRLQPSVPFYVVSQGAGDNQLLATVDSDVSAILGNYAIRTDEQRQYVATMTQLFYDYVTYGKLTQYDPRRRVINIGTEAISQEDYPNCNFWISNDIVPRYARID